MEKHYSYLYILQGIFLNGKGICFILCDTRGKILGGGFLCNVRKTVHSEICEIFSQSKQSMQVGAPLIQKTSRKEMSAESRR